MVWERLVNKQRKTTQLLKQIPVEMAGWDPENRWRVWPWPVGKCHFLLKAEGKGEEDEGGCSKACGHDKREEIKVFLVDGLPLLNKVRGRVEVLKNGESSKLLHEIKISNLGHLQEIQGEAKAYPRLETTNLQHANLLALQQKCQKYLRRTVYSRAQAFQDRCSLGWRWLKD